MLDRRPPNVFSSSLPSRFEIKIPESLTITRSEFLDWCQRAGFHHLEDIEPIHVATVSFTSFFTRSKSPRCCWARANALSEAKQAAPPLLNRKIFAQPSRARP